jgi:DNA-binding transcriptional MerR regulator
MKKQNHYSLQQLSNETQIPASTVRYYSKQYKEFFPNTRPEGSKNPVFDHECIEVLETIRKHQKDGLSRAEIILKLNKKFSPIIDQRADTATSEQATSEQAHNKQLATTNQQIPNVMQTISQLAEFSDNQVQLTEHYRLQNQQQGELIKELTKKTADLENEVLELKAENKKLQPKKNWWR